MIPIFDLHCHPSLKIYLCNKDMRRKHYPLKDVLPSGMHVDLPGMEDATVKVAFCSHYIPESGFGHLSKSKWLFRILKKLQLNIINKFEPDDHTLGAFYRAVTSIELLNRQITNAGKDFNVTVARNLQEFETANDEQKTIILHCLEGGHHLGRNLTTEQDYITNLESFKKMGVCLITIAHFFQNAICDSAGGIPPSTAKLIGYAKPSSGSNGLTYVGKLAVEWCQEHGMIIDLVHSTVEARNQVYEIIDDRKAAGLTTRPVIFSHSGIREMASANMPVDDDKYILPDLNELKRIKEYDGLIALILMNYWIVGIEEDSLFRNDRGIGCLLQTIEMIKNALGDFDHIAIGTDLDGFTQVPDDLSHVRHLGRLRNAIVTEFGEEVAEKICFKNALRTLRKGWS
jgi:microsomal dipeptidase-like Zn-dependent dipeptidase